MQLNRKTTGDYKNDRGFIGQDLDTLQRTINQMQQVIAAQAVSLTALQTQLASSNIAISASGQVSGLSNSKNLQTVAHDSTLIGAGTPTSPLGISNGFSSSLTSGPVTLTTLTLTSFFTLNTVPLTIVAGITNKVIVPVQAGFHVYKPSGAGYTNGNTSFQIRYIGSVNPSLGLSFNLALANSGTIKVLSSQAISASTTSGSSISGVGLEVQSGANVTNNGGAATIIPFVLYYTLPALGW